MDNYLHKILKLIFDSNEPDKVMQSLLDDNMTLGICKKTFKEGFRIGWKCKDCEKDPTAILCNDCFDKSKHEGHKYQIVNHPNGCCDCGDHEVWDKEGFCPAHQGFDEAKEPALAALP